MTPDFLTLTDLIISNGLVTWIGLRLVKRVDDLDNRVDNHETRLQLTERELNNAQKN